MNSSPDDFEGLRRLLALKKHEQPPPGYFHYLPDKIMVRIERSELAEHSTWWEWLVAKFDARPLLAGGYALGVSGLMLLGFKLSQDLQSESSANAGFAGGFFAGGLIGATPDPLTITPGATLQSHFANPAGLITFSSTGPILEEPNVTLSGYTRPALFHPAR